MTGLPKSLAPTAMQHDTEGQAYRRNRALVLTDSDCMDATVKQVQRITSNQNSGICKPLLKWSTIMLIIEISFFHLLLIVVLVFNLCICKNLGMIRTVTYRWDAFNFSVQTTVMFNYFNTTGKLYTAEQSIFVCKYKRNSFLKRLFSD